MTSEIKIKNGHSIIEVIISIFIIGIVLLIYHASSNTILLNRNAKNQELALRIAASKMEDLRNTPYGSLPASGPFSHSLLSKLPNSSANLTISDYNSKTKKVEVKVTWKDESNKNGREIKLTTLITQGGL